MGRAWLHSKKSLLLAWKAVRETVSPAGWLVIFLAVAGLSCGMTFGWAELIAAGAASSVLLLLSLPFLVGHKGYDVSLIVEKDRVTVGQDLPATVRVTNMRRSPALPGTIELPVGAGMVELPIPFLSSKAVTDRKIDISTSRRGIIDVGPPHVSTGDPLGLLRRERTWLDKHRVYIHPLTTVLPHSASGYVRDLEGSPSAKLINDDLAFHAIREYAVGDSRRQIHWKSTAKTGQLMVRQFEETRRSEMLVVLDVQEGGYQDNEEFELAVSVAASLGLRGLRDGRNLSIAMGQEAPPFASEEVRGLVHLSTLTPLSMLDGFSGVKCLQRVASFPYVVAQAAENADSVSIALLVVGSAVTTGEIRNAALSMPVGIPILTVICDLSAEPTVRRLGDLNVMTVGLLEDLRHLMSRGALE